MDNVILLIAGLIAIGLILSGLLVVQVIYKKKKGKQVEINYYVFFVLGLAFFPIGIVYLFIEKLMPLGLTFFAAGSSYLAIGLANRDKWKKN